MSTPQDRRLNQGSQEVEGEGGSACAFPLAAYSHHQPPP